MTAASQARIPAAVALSAACFLLAVTHLMAAADPASATVPAENGSIAFVSDETGNGEIYRMESDGSGRINLTNHPADDGEPAWSPDGTHIAFSSDRDGHNSIYVMRRDGAAPIRLTDGSAPAWSPDGEWIAFGDGSSVRAIRPDGTGLHTLIASRDPCEGQDPDFCPPGLYTLRYALPAWSPDGAALAVFEARVGPTPLAFSSSYVVIDASGEGPVEGLAPTTEGFNSVGAPSLDWSPEGTRVAMTVAGQRGPIGRIQPVGAGDPVLLSDPEDGDQWGVQSPAFSPDGSRIVYQRGTDLYIADATGGNPFRVTDTAIITESHPAWQPIRADVPTLFDPTTGRWHIRHLSGEVTTFYFGAPGDHPLIGDWNCDGARTPGVYRKATDTVYLRNRNSTGWPALAFRLGTPGIPIVGDWNGDGCDTIGVFNDGEVSYVNWLPPHNGTLRVGNVYWFGGRGDWPVTGDFNGDGIDTVAVHRPETGRIYVRNLLTTGPATFEFIYTRAGDRVLFGDWDGDGRDTVAGFRPQDATFRLNNDNSAGRPFEEVVFGEFDWIVPGMAPDQPHIFAVDPAADIHDLGLDDRGLPLVAVARGDEGLLYRCLDHYCSSTGSAPTFSINEPTGRFWSARSVIQYPTLVTFEAYEDNRWQIWRTYGQRFDMSNPDLPSAPLRYPGNAATDGIAFDGDYYVLAGVGNAQPPYCNPADPNQPCSGDEPLDGLRVHRCLDDDCTAQVLDEGAYRGGSLVLDRNGNPVMTYWRDGLRLARCDDPTCATFTLSAPIALDPDIDHLASMLIGPDGNPLFAYYEETGHNLKLAHCHTPDCSSISRVIVDGYGWVGAYPSLAIGPDGNPVIAYQQIGNKDLRLARCHNLDCTRATITTVDAVGRVGFNIHLTVDPRGNAIIAYEDLGQLGTYDPPLVKVATVKLD